MEGPLQVAAAQQRNRIPTEWLLEFDSWPDETLISLINDDAASRTARAYATWEMDYRRAFGMSIDS